MTDKNSNFPRGVEVVGSAIIENEKGEILLTKSPKWSNKWTFPGGHIEPGESIIDCVIREAMEEMGLKLKAFDIVALGELINSKDFHRNAHFVYFDVYCKVIGGELKLDNKELSDYNWSLAEDALKLDLAESFPETIQAYLNYKKSV